MSRRDLCLDVLRLGFAATGIVAMTYQYAVLDQRAGFRPANFFSFFTIQSNILAAALLMLLVLVRRESRTPLFDAVRGGITLYIAITGVVFAILLAGLQEGLQTTIPWVDFVVHKLIPVVVVVDWLADRPRHRLPLWTAAAWLGYPALWFAYTLARGPAADWYPYPFVDVDKLGYGGVFARGAGLIAFFAALAFAFVLLNNRAARRRDKLPAPAAPTV